MARRVGFSPTHGRRFAVNVVGGGVLDAPRRGQDPSLRCKRHMGGNGKVAGRACPAPTDCCFRQRGFGGAWRRTTSAASLLRKHARAVVCPAGANIARSPVSLRSTVAPRSQPRNTRLKSGGRGGGVKNEKYYCFRLAPAPSDFRFGVLRGVQPLRRGPLHPQQRDFSLLLSFGHKRK